MNKNVSLYLDALRIFAALAVFFSHLKRDSLSAGNPIIVFVSQFGQEGVALFFVISGVVIAYVAKYREHDLRSYLIARLGRLWSVMLPALILTIVLDTLGRSISPAMYAEPIPAWGWNLTSIWNALGSALFLNEVSFVSAEPGTNGPFWSLCYEYWYYMMFGAAYYLRGKWRIALLVVTTLIAGLKIIALFPIWLCGVAIYSYLDKRSQPRFGLVPWLASLTCLVLIMLFKYKIASLIVDGLTGVNVNVIQVSTFISHFVVGILGAANIVIFDRTRVGFAGRDSKLERCIRYLAARSFSLYLYQAPLLFFFGALTYNMTMPLVRLALVICASLIAIIALAEITEMRKRVFSSFANVLVPKFSFDVTTDSEIGLPNYSQKKPLK